MSGGLQYKPHKKQLEVHQFLGNNPKGKRAVLNWGRQTGKTAFSVNLTWIEAVKRQGRYFVIFPTYQQAYDTVWMQYLPFIPKELIKATDKTRLTITLHHLQGTITLPTGETIEVDHDESLPPSTIELKGSDEADRLRGAKVMGMVFDEYAYQKPTAWDEVFSPMFVTTNGWAIFISSPNGFNHFYDQYNFATSHPDEWFHSTATYMDNPAVERGFVEAKKIEMFEKGQENKFYQEYMAEFRQKSGLVYEHWNRDIHLVDPWQIPEEGTNVIGVDFGWENPSAVVFFKIDYDNNWWLFDEIYKPRLTYEELARLIKDKMGGKRLTLASGDSAAPEHIAGLQKAAIPILPVEKRKDSITKGIELCNNLLKPRIQLNGKPKPKLFVAKNCVNFIEEIESYSYPEKRPDKNLKEEPIKDKDHLMDAWRYIRLRMQDRVQQKYNFPDNPLKGSMI